MAADPPPFTSSSARISPSGPFGPPGGGGGGTFQIDIFNATALQTVFNLTMAPSDPAQVLMFVNGVLYEFGSDYTVAGQVLTWTDALFTLGAPDVVEIYYQVA